jgi:hypothetical protein
LPVVKSRKAAIMQEAENDGEIENGEIRTISRYTYFVLYFAVDAEDPKRFYYTIQNDKQYKRRIKSGGFFHEYLPVGRMMQRLDGTCPFAEQRSGR